MPYCRKCGTKLEEDARFCYKCGAPVDSYSYTSRTRPVHVPIRKDPIALGGIILLVILVSAAVLTVFLFAPIQTFSFSKSNSVANQPNINALNMVFQADNVQVNVFTQNFTDDAVMLYTSGKGAVAIGTKNPVDVTFSNQTDGDTLTVNAKVDTVDRFGVGFRVTCDIYLNPSMQLNLNVTTQTGQIALIANQTATFEALNLKSTTGEVKASLQNATTITGNLSLQTTTGALQFNMEQANVEGNRTFSFHTTTGAIDININKTQALLGNVEVDASTTVGSVNLEMQVGNGVGTRIQSQTNLGSINVDVKNFSGNKSPIQSNNYPAQSNFLVNLRTDVGSIHIKAADQNTGKPSLNS